MIPYSDRMKEHTIAVILCYGYTEGSGVAEFTLMFQSEVEEEIPLCDIFVLYLLIIPVKTKMSHRL